MCSGVAVMGFWNLAIFSAFRLPASRSTRQ